MLQTERRAARGLLVTPERELLLMCMELPWLATPIWIVPGGGLNPGETWKEALVRELHEETGLRVTSVGPHVWERTLPIEHHATLTRLHERYFVVHTPRFDPDTKRLEQRERAWFREFRWWPLTALSADPAVDAGEELRAIIERNA